MLFQKNLCIDKKSALFYTEAFIFIGLEFNNYDVLGE
ncbi:hypothetical protein C8C85_3209 [Flavobacterium sp. 103]|nr:hypothetical protein C8C85_3209 [Flavobacterium sp. 103]